jgi:hypothetical protein
MKYLIVIILFFNILSAEEKSEYLYFPSNWPQHKNIKMKDEIMNERYASLSENPLHRLKNINAYRMVSEKGIVSIYITKDNKCDIYFHASQKEYFVDGNGEPYLTFNIKKIDKCLEKIDIKGIERLLFYISASFWSGYFDDNLASSLLIEMIDYYGDYHYLETLDTDQQKTINDFVDQIETFFKKNGIDVNKKPEKAVKENKKEKEKKK